MIDKSSFLIFVVFFAFEGTSLATGPNPPNVVFILADDLGIGSLSCYGSDNYKTPNIDKLASTGTRYTRAFTASLCGTSRAMIMSGRYAFRNGSTNQDACIRMHPSSANLSQNSTRYNCERTLLLFLSVTTVPQKAKLRCRPLAVAVCPE